MSAAEDETPAPLPRRVERNEDGHVYVDGYPTGFYVDTAAKTLRGAAALDRAVADRLDAVAEHAETTGSLANLPVVPLAQMHRSRSAS